MRVKEMFKEDEKRGMLRGRFYDLVNEGEVVPMYNLCTLDHYYFKITKRGKVKRTEQEQKNLQEELYTAKKNAKNFPRKGRPFSLNPDERYLIAPPETVPSG